MIKLSELDVEQFALGVACLIRLYHLLRLYAWNACYFDGSAASLFTIDCIVGILEFLTRPTYNATMKIYLGLFLLSLPAFFTKDC